VDTLSYKTQSVKKADVKKEWFIIDATDMIVGRLASRVAMILRGKHKPSFTPHMDCGDKVIIINADKVRFSGKKLNVKTYFRHTGYPGGDRYTTPAQYLEKKPTEILRKALIGMLPKGPMGRTVLKNVYLYAGSEHPHEAQSPKELKL